MSMRIITTQLGFFGPAKRVPSRPRAVSTLQPRISTRLLRRNPLRPTSVIGHSSLSNFTKETSRNFASASGELPETIDIIVLDPRLLFTPFGDPLDPTYSDYVVGPFPIPKQLLENGGLDNVMEELDSYQPMNSFYFGERSEELFEYSFLGQHKTESDYTAIAVVPRLDELRDSGVDWDGFKALWRKAKADSKDMNYVYSPFRDSLPFFGNLETSYGLEGATVSVLKRDGVTTGLVITSIPGGGDD